MLSLKQGTDTLPAYVAKFERVLYEARGQDWPDVNKISTFRNGLNSTIRNRLAQQLKLPRQYPAFVKVVQQLAGRSPSSAVQPQPSSDSHQQRGGDPMDLNAIALNSIDIATPSRSSQSTSPSAPRARSISPGLREQYRLQGRCIHYESYDHWVGSCPI